MDEWISVIEREPETGGNVLVFDGSFHIAYFRPEQAIHHYRYDCDTYDVTPTHWMPLPEPPKE